MLYRGKLTKIAASGNELSCEVELMDGQKITNVEYVQEYGFASIRPVGSRVIIGFVLGDFGNATILKVEHPDYRPSLDAEEVAIYDKSGKVVKLDDGGNIEVNTKINSDSDIETSATVTCDEAVIDSITFSTHVHTDVESGSSNTGGPV